MTGSNNSFAVASGYGSNASSSATSFDPTLVALRAAAVREAAPVLHLNAEGDQALADIEQVDDESRVRSGLSWFGGLATDSSAGPIGNLLRAFVAGVIGLNS